MSCGPDKQKAARADGKILDPAKPAHPTPPTKMFSSAVYDKVDSLAEAFS